METNGICMCARSQFEAKTTADVKIRMSPHAPEDSWYIGVGRCRIGYFSFRPRPRSGAAASDVEAALGAAEALAITEPSGFTGWEGCWIGFSGLPVSSKPALSGEYWILV